MNPLYRVTTTVLLALITIACTPAPTVHKQDLYVFGTLVNISAYTTDSDRFDEAVAAVDASFQQMHNHWHVWKGEGALVKLNRALAAGESHRVDPFLLPLIKQARSLSIESQHLFNPAIGQLIALWGFHSDEPPGGKPPSREAINDLVKLKPLMSDLVIEGDQVTSSNPAVKIDLGAHAKGYALQLVIKTLSEFGIDHTIVNAGGDLCVAGQRGERPWHVGIRHPQGKGVIASMDVADGECVLTSGNYERYREYEQIRYAHIIDPRKGYPVEHVASATVIAADGGLADAAATALSVAGPSQWLDISRSMKLNQVMLVDEKGRVYLTPDMQQRVIFQDDPNEVIVARP